MVIITILKQACTLGRGSYYAITKQIETKFLNGTIGRISNKTFLKMLAYNLFSNSFDAGMSGIIDAYKQTVDR